ncbi:hypothetical protein PG996_009152 [Apiospora saccharicola]|uniref:Prion-inhibition and propagation HeLo domain-containing protein n=1 Tax=Apiospora saccharicola TaxID=335842 RepID=A0ABR1UJY1_9PEZI
MSCGYPLTICGLTRICRALFTDCRRTDRLMVGKWAENQLGRFNLWAADIGNARDREPSFDTALHHDRNSRDMIRKTLSILKEELEKCKTYAKDLEMDESLEEFQTIPSPRSDEGPEADLLENAKREVNLLLGTLHSIVLVCRARYASWLEAADSQFVTDNHAELERHLETKLFEKGPYSSRTNTGSESQVVPELSEIQKRLVNANLKRRNRIIFVSRQSDGLDTVTHIQEPLNNTDQPSGTAESNSDTDIQGSSVTNSVETAAATASQAPRIEPPYYTFAPARNNDAVYFKCPCCCEDLPTLILGGSHTDVWK